jgi:hypothetical protein
MAGSTKPTPRRKAVKAEIVPSTSSTKKSQTKTTESLEMIVGQLENALPQQFSEKHIDRYFDNQDKVMKYIREDHKDRAELVKHGRSFTLQLSLIISCLLIALVLIIAVLDKNELDKFLGYLFAFLGGTGVGGVGTNILSAKQHKHE